MVGAETSEKSCDFQEIWRAETPWKETTEGCFFFARNAPLILAPSNKIHDIHMYEFISMSFFNTSYYYTIYTNIFYIPSYDAHFDIFCRDASVDIPRLDRLVES